MSDTIDTLATTFVSASAALGEALIAELSRTDPILSAKVAQAVAQGERLMVAFELDGVASSIRLLTVDDYQRVKRVMHIGAAKEARR